MVAAKAKKVSKMEGEAAEGPAEEKVVAAENEKMPETESEVAKAPSEEEVLVKA